jgi:modulator of FtsH protease
MSSTALTDQQPLTREQSATLFSQTMGLVAVTAGVFALGAYLARDVSPGWSWFFFIASFATLLGLSAATRRSASMIWSSDR